MALEAQIKSPQSGSITISDFNLIYSKHLTCSVYLSTLHLSVNTEKPKYTV